MFLALSPDFGDEVEGVLVEVADGLLLDLHEVLTSAHAAFLGKWTLLLLLVEVVVRYDSELV